MNNQHYNVFLNYRRDPGRDFARTLQQAFKARGYSVFFDYDSLQDGKFNEEIYSAIENCDVFIVSYSKGSLDRCRNEGDWVRIEIEHALKHGKKIVPVAPTEVFYNLEFPHDLPRSLSVFNDTQTTEIYTGQYFDDSIDRCVKVRFPKGMVREKAKRVDEAGKEAERLFREGRKHENGEYEHCDMGKALACYRAVAEMGHPDAQFEVGTAYSEGWGGRVSDMELAIEWWEKAAEGGSPDAMYALACRYKEGTVLEKNEGLADELCKKAFSIWKRRAAVDDSQAQRRLADCYAAGIGTQIDEQLSLTWYRKAAEGNDIWALLELGLWRNSMLDDDEEKKWRPMAISHLKNLARKGNPWCQNQMGDFYSGFYDNEHTNLDEAIRWYEKAAEQGVSSAMYNLGVRYLKGDGIDVNFKKASRLLAQAVRNGNESALYDYGVCLLLGLGEFTEVNQNEKAIDCFRKCASKYNPEAWIDGSEESYEIINIFDERVGRSGIDAALALACAECWGTLAKAHESNGHQDISLDDMRKAACRINAGVEHFKGPDGMTAAGLLRDVADRLHAVKAHESKEFCNRALMILEPLSDASELKGDVFYVQAKALRNLKDIQSAMLACQKAVNCYASGGDDLGLKEKLADSLSMLGQLQRNQGCIGEAVASLKSANARYADLQKAEYIGNNNASLTIGVETHRFPMALNYCELAKCYLRMNNKPLAYSRIKAALGELAELNTECNSQLASTALFIDKEKVSRIIDSVQRLNTECDSLLASSRPFNCREMEKVSGMIREIKESMRLVAKTGWYDENKFCDMVVFDDVCTIPLLILPENENYRPAQPNGRGRIARSTEECVVGDMVFPELLVQLAEKSLDAIWPKRKENNRHCRCLIVGSSSFVGSIRQHWGRWLEYLARETFWVRFCSYSELRAELCKCFDIEYTGQVKGDEYDVWLEGIPKVSYKECVTMIRDAVFSSFGRWGTTRYIFAHLPQLHQIYDNLIGGDEQLVPGINLIQKISHDEAIAIRSSLVKNGAIASVRPINFIQG